MRAEHIAAVHHFVLFLLAILSLTHHIELFVLISALLDGLSVEEASLLTDQYGERRSGSWYYTGARQRDCASYSLLLDWENILSFRIAPGR